MAENVPKLDYASPPAEPPKGALRIIFMIVFMDLMGFGIIIPLLPFYALRYQASALKVTVLFSIYSICQFLAAPMLGAISDRYGRRPVLVLSQLGSAAGYLLLGVVTQYDFTNLSLALGLVYLSRIIDGLSGGNISTAQAYISDVTTDANRAKGMGLLGAAFGIGFAVGPALGGLLGDEHHHAAYPAYAAAAFSFLAMVLTYFFLPESRVHRPTEAETWLHPARFAPIFQRSVLVQLLVISAFSMGAFVMMESSIALFLSRPETFHWGPRQVGWFFAFSGVVIIVIQGGLIGRLTRMLGEWTLAIVGPLLVAGGMLCMMRTAWHPILLVLLVGGVFNAGGRSLQGPTLSSLISKFSDRSEQGTVFGLYHGLMSLSRVIGPVVAGLVYERHITAPFVLAATITGGVAIWTGVLRSTAMKVSDNALAVETMPEVV